MLLAASSGRALHLGLHARRAAGRPPTRTLAARAAAQQGPAWGVHLYSAGTPNGYKASIVLEELGLEQGKGYAVHKAGPGLASGGAPWGALGALAAKGPALDAYRGGVEW